LHIEISKPEGQDLLIRARNMERKRRWRQSQENGTLEEAASRRAQRTEEPRQWHRSQQENERVEKTD
jgi:hypothetical protein